MSTVLKHARILWVLAFCVMVAGTVVHVCQDAACTADHAAEHDTADSGDSGGHSDHFCGHCHCSGLPVTPQSFVVLRPHAGPLAPLTSERPAPGPAKEIEHPPQLS